MQKLVKAEMAAVAVTRSLFTACTQEVRAVSRTDTSATRKGHNVGVYADDVRHCEEGC
jgi:hypothetical protein